MKGSRFIWIFLLVTITSAIAISLWIKQGYDTRPKVQIKSIEDTKN